MNSRPEIDVTFDFRSDTPPRKDPDARSPTLRGYHRRLWSKALPSGPVFELSQTTPGVYLHHRSGVGEFFLSSDSVIPTFLRRARLAHITEQLSRGERDEFDRVSYTMGGMMIFPGNCVDRHMTINGARGCHPRIQDRFDLTLECIRRHYRGEHSPLSDTLARYSDFFALFGDFRGYVEFFLLQDLVTADYAAVRFSLPFADFGTSPLPGSLDAYRSYRDNAVDFIEARKCRILARC